MAPHRAPPERRPPAAAGRRLRGRAGDATNGPGGPGVSRVHGSRGGKVQGARHPAVRRVPPHSGHCDTSAMEMPQHWVTADGFSPHLGAGGGTLTVWGWSSESEADAARVAQQRLAEALERIAREGGLPPGRGYYP